MSIKTGFLGLGKMATAMIDGMLRAGLAKPDEICGFDVSPERSKIFADKGCLLMKDAAEVVSNSDTIVIAVKPQNFTELFASLEGRLTSDKLLLSIAAGVPISRIKQLVGTELPVIRVIPNSPLLLGEGMSALAAEPPVTEEQKQLAEAIFSACGKTVWIPESQINPITTVHSSSPAYLYLFAKATAEYAESVGIDAEEATRMFAQTLIGSGRMILESGSDLDTLIAAVRSPGGTTAAALDVFAQKDFCGTVIAAMNACTDRAEELGRLS